MQFASLPSKEWGQQENSQGTNLQMRSKSWVLTSLSQAVAEFPSTDQSNLQAQPRRLPNMEKTLELRKKAQ